MNISERTYEELLSSYLPLIKKLCKRLGNQRYYDELYQIGLIALWEAKTNYNEEKGHFPSYAKKFIWGRMLSFLRKENKFNEKNEIYFDQELIEEISAPEPDTSSTQPQLPLEKTKSLLSKREQQWFYEAIINEKKPTEIAELLNVSVSTVHTWRKNVIRKLRPHIGTRGQVRCPIS